MLLIKTLLNSLSCRSSITGHQLLPVQQLPTGACCCPPSVRRLSPNRRKWVWPANPSHFPRIISMFLSATAHSAVPGSVSHQAFSWPRNAVQRKAAQIHLTHRKHYEPLTSSATRLLLIFCSQNSEEQVIVLVPRRTRFILLRMQRKFHEVLHSFLFLPHSLLTKWGWEKLKKLLIILLQIKC